LTIGRGGFTMDSLGRRKTIMIAASINLVGAILQCAAQNLAMILVGRIMAGWAVGLLSMSVPIYQTECAHPKTRGPYQQENAELFKTKPDRSHHWSYSADDWSRVYCLDLGRIWLFEGASYEFLLLAFPTCIPMRPMHNSHCWHTVLPGVPEIPRRNRPSG